MHRSQHWFRLWIGVWRLQSITWINVKVFCGIHQRAWSQEIPMTLIRYMCSEITTTSPRGQCVRTYRTSCLHTSVWRMPRLWRSHCYRTVLVDPRRLTSGIETNLPSRRCARHSRIQQPSPNHHPVAQNVDVQRSWPLVILLVSKQVWV